VSEVESIHKLKCFNTLVLHTNAILCTRFSAPLHAMHQIKSQSRSNLQLPNHMAMNVRSESNEEDSPQTLVGHVPEDTVRLPG
jgi:hypothetical protein